MSPGFDLSGCAVPNELKVEIERVRDLIERVRAHVLRTAQLTSAHKDKLAKRLEDVAPPPQRP